MKKINLKYPIQPHHLLADEEPLGFDDILDYEQTMILWNLILMWKEKGRWKPIQHGEFIAWLQEKQAGQNSTISIAARRLGKPFSFEAVKKVLNVDEHRNYSPTHFMLCRYFAHNPA